MKKTKSTTTDSPAVIAPEHPFRSVRRAGVPLVAWETADPAATINACRKSMNGNLSPCLSWDVIQGLRPITDGTTPELKAQTVALCEQYGEPINTTNLPQCLSLVAAEPPPQTVIFIHAANRVLEDWTAAQAVWNLRDIFKRIGSVLVLLGPSIKLPPELANDIPQFEEPTPTPEQVEKEIETTVRSAKKQIPDMAEPTDDDKARIADTLTGYLSMFGIEQSLALSVRKEGLNLRRLWELKVASLKNTAGLEISQPTTTFANLAGCSGAKTFLSRLLNGRQRPRAVYFLDELEKMISGSSGGDLSGTSQKQIEQFLYWTAEKNVLAILLVGIPGGGKSFTAQCTAGEGKMPLLRGSISAAQGSLVGQSTKNMRVMLKTVDSVSGGQPLLIATCNSLESLTPEVLSRFKMGVFVYDYPNGEEAAALWNLYRKKYELGDQATPATATNWTGREIESCCHRAWLFNCPLDEAAKSVVPVFRANREKMEALRKSLSGRFLSAATEGVYTHSDTTKQPVSDGRRFGG